MAFPWDVLVWAIKARFKLTPPVAADGEFVELQSDANGRLLVVVQGPRPAGYRRPGASLEHRAVAKASPGSLLEAYGFNDDDATSYYLQFFDKAVSPVDNDVPLVSVKLRPGDNFSFNPSSPLAFATGIAWALSTSPTKYTSGATSKAYVAVVYQ